MLEALLSWSFEGTFPGFSEAPDEMCLAGRVQDRLGTPTRLRTRRVRPMRARPRAARELVRIGVVPERGGFCTRPLHRAAPDLHPAGDGAAVVGGDHLHHAGAAHRHHPAARRLPGRHRRKGLVSPHRTDITASLRNSDADFHSLDLKVLINIASMINNFIAVLFSTPEVIRKTESVESNQRNDS